MNISKAFVLVEKILISLFAALLVYMIVSMVLSATGIVGPWPYPHP